MTNNLLQIYKWSKVLTNNGIKYSGDVLMHNQYKNMQKNDQNTKILCSIPFS